MKKTTRRYYHFTHVYQKLWLDDVQFLRYGARQTDRWMDRQKKWHIEVAAPPKKTKLLTERKFWSTNFTKKCLKRSEKGWSPFANYNSLHHSSIKKMCSLTLPKLWKIILGRIFKKVNFISDKFTIDKKHIFNNNTKTKMKATTTTVIKCESK